jgi:hypothetical protein
MSENKTTTKIEIRGVQGTQLTVKLTGLPGNTPKTYGNYLVLWRNQNSIPYNDPNDNEFQAIEINTSQGTEVFSDVTIAPNVTYVVGYAVGPKLVEPKQIWGNICTTGFYVNDVDPVIYTEPSLYDLSVDADSISMKYLLPDGANPNANGAWIGVWESGQASYNTAPKWKARIGSTSNRGGAFINGMKIVIGQVYTVALFTSGFGAGPDGTDVQTAMSCTTTVAT